MRVYYERYSAHFEAKFVKIKILFVIIHTTECSRKSSQATVPLMLLPSHHSFVGLFSFLISLLSSCLAGRPDWLVRAPALLGSLMAEPFWLPSPRPKKPGKRLPRCLKYIWIICSPQCEVGIYHLLTSPLPPSKQPTLCNIPAPRGEMLTCIRVWIYNALLVQWKKGMHFQEPIDRRLIIASSPK